MAQKIGLLVCGNSGIDYLDINFPLKQCVQHCY